MSDISPPDQPGWYADAHGAWWWWDGATWTPAPGASPVVGAPSSPREQERTNALLMWILYILVGGWIVALIFYLISKEKPFVRHHAAEALNLTLVLLVPQIVGFGLLLPGYIDFISESIDDPNASFTFTGTFWAGVALLGIVSLLNYGLGIAGAVMAHRGRWWRLPIGLHPVRGVLPKGEAPPYDVTST
ncbi:MAG TPA: DUF4870 domain-containing protein [Iamia sp.]|nr:DUF4870 domain-containing protein [Iamia sp.]